MPRQTMNRTDTTSAAGRYRTVEGIASLPDRPLQSGHPLQDAFLECGITSFHGARAWVHQLPYGVARSGEPAMALFATRRGTCSTKHGAIAALAYEMGLAVHKHLGFYRLGSEILPGAETVLDPFAL